jgi:hypothetical protein
MKTQALEARIQCMVPRHNLATCFPLLGGGGPDEEVEVRTRHLPPFPSPPGAAHRAWRRLQ